MPKVHPEIENLVDEAFGFLAQSREAPSPRQSLNFLQAAEVALIAAREAMEEHALKTPALEKNLDAVRAEIERTRHMTNRMLFDQTVSTAQQFLEEGMNSTVDIARRDARIAMACIEDCLQQIRHDAEITGLLVRYYEDIEKFLNQL